MVSKDYLYQLYTERNLTTREVGNILGVTHRTILNWLQSYGIPKKKQSDYPSKPGYWKGRHLTDSAKLAISDARKRNGSAEGNRNPRYSGGGLVQCEMCTNEKWVTPSERAIKSKLFCSRECKNRWQSISMVGMNSHFYKDGLYPEREKLRRGAEYRAWRKAVIDRDGSQCVLCGSKNDIEVDHIKRFSDFPELRFVVENGRALCKGCHRGTDNWGNNYRDVKGRFAYG